MLVEAYNGSLIDIRHRLVLTDCTTAEIIKYAANCYLAMKISYFNELYDLCNTLDANYSSLRIALEMDPRIGPGDEATISPSNRGFDDECLPKDLDAFLTFLVKHNLPSVLHDATAKANARVRPGLRGEVPAGEIFMYDRNSYGEEP